MSDPLPDGESPSPDKSEKSPTGHDPKRSIRISAEIARKQSLIKKLELADLRDARLKKGRAAYASGLARESCGDLYERLQFIDDKIAYASRDEELDKQATAADKMRHAAGKAKRTAEIEVLRSQRKALLIDLGAKAEIPPGEDTEFDIHREKEAELLAQIATLHEDIDERKAGVGPLARHPFVVAGGIFAIFLLFGLGINAWRHDPKSPDDAPGRPTADSVAQDSPEPPGENDNAIIKDPKLAHEYPVAQEFLENATNQLEAREKELWEKSGKAAAQRGIPTFASANDWDRAYRSTEAISRAEFLKRLPSVSLEVITNGTLREKIDPGLFDKPIEAAVRAAGIDISPASPVQLQTRLFLTGSELSKDSSEMIRTQRVTAYTLTVDTSFRLSTLVRRGDTFHRMEVFPISDARIFGIRGDRLPAENLVGYVEQGIKFSLEKESTNDNVTSTNRDTWVKSLWSERKADEMYTRYREASREPDALQKKAYRGVTDLRPVMTYIGDHKKQRLPERTVTSAWNREMKAHGFPVSEKSSVGIYHEIYTSWHGYKNAVELLFSREVDDNFTFASKISLYQRDVVYPLGDQLVRSTVQMDPRFATEETFFVQGALKDFVLEEIAQQFDNLELLR